MNINLGLKTINVFLLLFGCQKSIICFTGLKLGCCPVCPPSGGFGGEFLSLPFTHSQTVAFLDTCPIVAKVHLVIVYCVSLELLKFLHGTSSDLTSQDSGSLTLKRGKLTGSHRTKPVILRCCGKIRRYT